MLAHNMPYDANASGEKTDIDVVVFIKKRPPCIYLDGGQTVIFLRDKTTGHSFYVM